MSARPHLDRFGRATVADVIDHVASVNLGVVVEAFQAVVTYYEDHDGGVVQCIGEIVDDVATDRLGDYTLGTQ